MTALETEIDDCLRRLRAAHVGFEIESELGTLHFAIAGAAAWLRWQRIATGPETEALAILGDAATVEREDTAWRSLEEPERKHVQAILSAKIDILARAPLFLARARVLLEGRSLRRLTEALGLVPPPRDS